MRLGIISDTHNHLDPRIGELFAGVEGIVHAGDIGLPWLILQLEEIAPVTAVTGNTDEAIPFPETAILNFSEKKILVHHIVDLHRPGDRIHHRIREEKPAAVIFGHSHRQFCETRGNIMYLNPGYAGRQRFELPRSVAILTVQKGEFSAQFFPL